MRQFKCPLAWFEWRAGSPISVFFREGGVSMRGGIDPDAGISPCANRMGEPWLKNYTSGVLREVITHPCLNFNGGLILTESPYRYLYLFL